MLKECRDLFTIWSGYPWCQLVSLLEDLEDDLVFVQSVNQGGFGERCARSVHTTTERNRSINMFNVTHIKKRSNK